MKPFLVIFLLCGFLYQKTAPLNIHPFHLSICDIEQNESQGIIEISVKIFIDDLVKSISEEGFLNEVERTDIDILMEQKNKILESYLSEHFAIKINGLARQQNYLGLEVENDAIWCYLEIKCAERIKVLTAKNSILLKSFPSQNNIINAKIRGIKKSLIFSIQEFEGELLFP